VTVTDADLVQQVTRGHLESLGLLFDRQHAPLRRFLSRLQVPPGDLDDLVQMIFLEVPRAAARFDPARSVTGWLFGVAAMVARRHRRSLGRLARKVVALSREPPGGGQATPAELVAAGESVRRVAHALATLSARKREVFVMIAMEDLPAEAVAQALGIPVGTVWTRLHHARKELQALLHQAEDRGFSVGTPRRRKGGPAYGTE
jgi:RNA polymerase sigma-70 factor (ECF subfamily)